LKPPQKTATGSKRQTLEEETKEKIDGLTKIIWNCSGLIDRTKQEKKGMNTIE
jgi:hypothetical protein